MKHAREDYNRIQDPAGLIPEDEPVFLLRGQDKAASLTVLIYSVIADYMGADPDLVDASVKQSEEMRLWKTKKIPDITYKS